MSILNRHLWFGLLLSAVFFSIYGCVSKSHYMSITDQRVTLFLKAPEARSVVFSSSMDSFEHHPARRGNAGVWEITVPGKKEFT